MPSPIKAARTPVPTSARTLARRYALLGLYQWQLDRQTAADISAHFHDDPTWMQALARGLAGFSDDEPLTDESPCDHQLFDQLLRGVIDHVEQLDHTFAPFLDRSIASLDPVERAILRLATFELLYSPEIPFPVILNEAIDLAKIFGAEKSHKFVNGVMHRVARLTRHSS